MERRASTKPYCKAIANYPRHKEEIDQLPEKYWEILARFVYVSGTYAVDEEDFFESLVLYCIEADHSANGSFRSRALQIAESELREQRRETERLYNPYRNLYLDKCYGGSTKALGEWMNFRQDEEE